MSTIQRPGESGNGISALNPHAPPFQPLLLDMIANHEANREAFWTEGDWRLVDQHLPLADKVRRSRGPVSVGEPPADKLAYAEVNGGDRRHHVNVFWVTVTFNVDRFGGIHQQRFRGPLDSSNPNYLGNYPVVQPAGLLAGNLRWLAPVRFPDGEEIPLFAAAGLPFRVNADGTPFVIPRQGTGRPSFQSRAPTHLSEWNRRAPHEVTLWASPNVSWSPEDSRTKVRYGRVGVQALLDARSARFPELMARSFFSAMMPDLTEDHIVELSSWCEHHDVTAVQSYYDGGVEMHTHMCLILHPSVAVRRDAAMARAQEILCTCGGIFQDPVAHDSEGGSGQCLFHYLRAGGAGDGGGIRMGTFDIIRHPTEDGKWMLPHENALPVHNYLRYDDASKKDKSPAVSKFSLDGTIVDKFGGPLPTGNRGRPNQSKVSKLATFVTKHGAVTLGEAAELAQGAEEMTPGSKASVREGFQEMLGMAGNGDLSRKNMEMLARRVLRAAGKSWNVAMARDVLGSVTQGALDDLSENRKHHLVFKGDMEISAAAAEGAESQADWAAFRKVLDKWLPEGALVPEPYESLAKAVATVALSHVEGFEELGLDLKGLGVLVVSEESQTGKSTMMSFLTQPPLKRFVGHLTMAGEKKNVADSLTGAELILVADGVTPEEFKTCQGPVLKIAEPFKFVLPKKMERPVEFAEGGRVVVITGDGKLPAFDPPGTVAAQESKVLKMLGKRRRVGDGAVKSRVGARFGAMFDSAEGPWEGAGLPSLDLTGVRYLEKDHFIAAVAVFILTGVKSPPLVLPTAEECKAKAQELGKSMVEGVDWLAGDGSKGSTVPAAAVASHQHESGPSRPGLVPRRLEESFADVAGAEE